MFISMTDRETPLTDADEAYINALGEHVFDFGNKLDSQLHAHLSHKIQRDGEDFGLSPDKLNDILHTVGYITQEENLDEEEMIAFIQRLAKSDHYFATKIYTHAKFVHALGMATLAYGIDSLALTEPGDPTVQGTMDDLHDVLKEMKYGDWEVKMMKQRFTAALHDFSVEYFGGRGRG